MVSQQWRNFPSHFKSNRPQPNFLRLTARHDRHRQAAIIKMSQITDLSTKAEKSAEKSRKSQEKRQRMREQLRFMDPSKADITVPAAIRKFSPKLALKGDALKIKARSISEESSKLGSSSEESARKYVADRASFAEDVGVFCQDVRKAVNQMDVTQQLDKPTA